MTEWTMVTVSKVQNHWLFMYLTNSLIEGKYLICTEIYDEDGYGYNMVEDGVNAGEGENYQTEELKTDGNVTYGTVITAQDTGIQYFQCAYCPSAKVFKHRQSCKEHYLLNHSPTPPAFQCQCGRRFLKQSQLKRHEVVHTAERPFGNCKFWHQTQRGNENYILTEWFYFDSSVPSLWKGFHKEGQYDSAHGKKSRREKAPLPGVSR